MRAAALKPRPLTPVADNSREIVSAARRLSARALTKAPPLAVAGMGFAAPAVRSAVSATMTMCLAMATLLSAAFAARTKLASWPFQELDTGNPVRARSLIS